VAGKLRGYVTPTTATLLLEFQPGSNKNGNAAGRIQFRRRGTTEWRDALDPQWVDTRAETSYPHIYTSSGEIVYMSGTLFGLAPNETYEARFTVSDPDGVTAGGEFVTTVTTAGFPRSQGNKVIEVSPGQDFDQAVRDLDPGTIVLMREGHYTGKDGILVIPNLSSGTEDNYVVFMPHPDNKGPVTAEQLLVSGSYVHVHGLTITTDKPRYGAVSTYHPSDLEPLRGVVFSGLAVNGPYHELVTINSAHQTLILDSTLSGLTGDPRRDDVTSEGITLGSSQGALIAGVDITNSFDGISNVGHGSGVTNSVGHALYDNFIEFDRGGGNGFALSDDAGRKGPEEGLGIGYFSWQGNVNASVYMRENTFAGFNKNVPEAWGPDKQPQPEAWKVRTLNPNVIGWQTGFVGFHQIGRVGRLLERPSLFVNNFFGSVTDTNVPPDLGDIYNPPHQDTVMDYNFYQFFYPGDREPYVWNVLGGFTGLQKDLGLELHSNFAYDKPAEN